MSELTGGTIELWGFCGVGKLVGTFVRFKRAGVFCTG